MFRGPYVCRVIHMLGGLLVCLEGHQDIQRAVGMAGKLPHMVHGCLIMLQLWPRSSQGQCLC